LYTVSTEASVASEDNALTTLGNPDWHRSCCQWGVTTPTAPSSLAIPHLHAAYAGGLAPADVVRTIYDRIAQVADPAIFIDIVPMAEALAAAAALPPFDPLAFPLWGIPFAVKDNIDVAGRATTAACPAFAYAAQASAPVVERVLAAGAILIGKTNLDQFATGLVGVRSPYGAPRNAFDPRRVPGGSSSGSAVAVARGLASFAFGTDTAGSGRVPAGLNNLVGMKPSLGLLSTRGVVPACRTLDCVSIFAASVADAEQTFQVAAGYDAEDPYSRRGSPASQAPVRSIGVPRPADRLFFGDAEAEAAFEDALAGLRRDGLALREIDMTPFFETARLLYEGPWVAERRAAVRAFMDRQPGDMHPVTRAVIAKADAISATDTFEAFYRLAALKRETEPVWGEVDALAVPTAPIAPLLSDLEADPLGPNTRLGTYTNFVNLLDLCALAVPGPFRRDGMPAGFTLIAPRDQDRRLLTLGARIFPGVGGRTEPALEAA
jgi:allophanate hydrolase